MNKAKLHRIFSNIEMNPRDRKDLVNELTKGGSGGGVTIVDSVDKLDENAPVGSLAVVAIPSTEKEISFGDLKCITQDDLISSGGSLSEELLSKFTIVNKIQITIPKEPVNLNEQQMMLLFATLSQKMLIFGLGASTDGKVSTIIAALEGGSSGENVILQIGQYTEQGATIIDSELKKFNDILLSEDWYFLGKYATNTQNTSFELTEEDIVILDLHFKAIQGQKSYTKPYIKGDKWEIALDEELKEIDTKIDTKADIISLETRPYNRNNPNTLKSGKVYNYSFYSSTHLEFILDDYNNTSESKEYMLQIYCGSTPSGLTFLDEYGNELSIAWINGIAPSFIEDTTCIISILNGFGVYGIFLLNN